MARRIKAGDLTGCWVLGTLPFEAEDATPEVRACEEIADQDGPHLWEEVKDEIGD